MRRAAYVFFTFIVIISVVAVIVGDYQKFSELSIVEKVSAIGLIVTVFLALAGIIVTVRKQQRKIFETMKTDHEFAIIIKPVKNGVPSVLTKDVGFLTFYQLRGRSISRVATFEAKDFTIEKIVAKSGWLAPSRDALRLIDQKETASSPSFDFYVLDDSFSTPLSYEQGDRLGRIMEEISVFT